LTSHDCETTDSVPDIVHIGKEVQCGVIAAVCACDMKKFSVPYVSGFIAKRLLNNSSRDICKKGAQQYSSLLHIGVVGGDCWYCCDCFGEGDVKDGSLRVI
jgi:hypothetical protein